MRIECVVVSVNCGDYLSHTLPLTKPLFNRQVVVTSADDEETRRVARHYNVECLVTDAFYRGGDKFNKGRAVNEALEHLEKTGGFKEWAVHMDADIVLPPLSRQILHTIPLNEQCLYGIDRVMCPNYERWVRFMQSPLPQHDQSYVHVGPFPVGTRLYKPEQGGWVPLGFFQMFHRASNHLKTPYYPIEWDSAATSDLYMAYKWPREKRVMIPEIVAYHLATDDVTGSAMGQNWLGRRTSRFEAPDPFAAFGGYRPTPKKDTNNH